MQYERGAMLSKKPRNIEGLNLHFIPWNINAKNELKTGLIGYDVAGDNILTVLEAEICVHPTLL